MRQAFAPRARVGAFLLGVAVLAGCAAPAMVRPGVARDDVTALWGEPLASYQLPAGQRLFYRTKPGQVQSLDFDATGKLVGMEQALTAQRLGRITAGQWRAADVQLAFGPPAKREANGDQGSVWTYFFQEYGTHRRARVLLDPAGAVVRTEFADDPAADERYR
ncbi:hypothetical protein [Simplicispira lacusdiani]|uniref:hypothetical protein n=1 Tax=Simplicispira lacusdiani TaxID=2213010 RepID=UPI001300981E|nr:hypothetical protein [Simplicispira lacusdiani]